MVSFLSVEVMVPFLVFRPLTPFLSLTVYSFLRCSLDRDAALGPFAPSPFLMLDFET